MNVNSTNDCPAFKSFPAKMTDTLVGWLILVLRPKSNLTIIMDN